MAKKSRTLILSGLVVLVIVVAAVMVYQRRGPEQEELLYHNEMIVACKTSTKEIVLALRELPEGIQQPERSGPVSITEQAKIQTILDSLIIDNVRHPLGESHDCLGHLRIEILAGNEIYRCRYDHGKCITPITNGDRWLGTIDLASRRCKKLNALLFRLGFTERELGI